MDIAGIVAATVIGLAIGAIAVFVLLRSRLNETQSKLETSSSQLREIEIQHAVAVQRIETLTKVEESVAERDKRIENLNQRIAEKSNEITQLSVQISERENALNQRIASFEENVKTVFEAMSKRALSSNSEYFSQLADEKFQDKEKAINSLIKPLDEKLKEYDQKLTLFEKARSEQVGSQKSLLETLMQEIKEQKRVTGDLKNVLSGSSSRGKVGEVFLKRLLDEAGLVEPHHYSLQVHESSQGGGIRPDCIVKLPGKKSFIIDAKTPMKLYEDAILLEDQDLRKSKLREHAASVRAMINELAKKEYRQKSAADADYVIAYFPFDASLNAAYEADPDLTVYGWDKGVICATPAVLFALLRTVAITWGEEKRAQGIEEICKLGKDMVHRIRVVADHFRKVGKNLDDAVTAYNAAAGSIESQLLTTGAKFQRLGIGIEEKLQFLPEIEKETKEFKKTELQSLPFSSQLEAIESSDEETLTGNANRDEFAE